MESYNRITLYMAFLVIIVIVLLPCAIAQNGGRGSRGGDMMGGDMMGGGMMGGDMMGGDMMGGGMMGGDMMGGGMMGGGMMGGGIRGGEREGPGSRSGERDNRGGGRVGPGRGSFPYQDEELSESQIDRIMKRFSQVNPTKAKELEELRKTNKEKFIYELRGNAFVFVAQEMRETREYREVLELCEKFSPGEVAGIRELKDDNYELYKKRLDPLRDKYRSLIFQYQQGETSDELMQILVRDLQLYLKLSELSMQYWNPATTAEKKNSLLSEIKDVHSEQYDQDIKRTKISLQEIKKEIDRLNARLEGEKKQVEAAEVPEVKEKEIAEIMKIYTDSTFFRRGRFGSRRPMMPPTFQMQDQNSNPAP